MTVTKQGIAEHVSKIHGINSKQSLEITDKFFNVVKKQLITGRDVWIMSLGNFKLRDKRERRGRNPMTGESMMISARRVVTFKASAKMVKGLRESQRD